jgi:Zn finger protein HypA/HybF involved in hydrogenase expression
MGKPVKRGYWKVQEHLSGDATFQCSRCKGVFQNREAFCPKCHSENKKVSYDPVWVDEIEMMDAIFDDDI